jgi:hypothetical protein
MVLPNLSLVAYVAGYACLASIASATPSITADKRVYTCTIEANGDGSDDAPAIRDAFAECQDNARIVFQDTTYYINSPLNTTTLSNVDIDIYGYLLVCLRFGRVFFGRVSLRDFVPQPTSTTNNASSSGAMIPATGSIIQCLLGIRISPPCGS